MSVGGFLEEVESKKAEQSKILRNYNFVTAKQPWNAWFTRAERDTRTGVILGLIDLTKVDPGQALEERLLKQLDRALYRLGLNQVKDLKSAAQARTIRQVLSYDRPHRGRPKGAR